jgi:hypothetical protein
MASCLLLLPLAAKPSRSTSVSEVAQPNYDVVVTHADVWLRLFSRLAT